MDGKSSHKKKINSLPLNAYISYGTQSVDLVYEDPILLRMFKINEKGYISRILAILSFSLVLIIAVSIFEGTFISENLNVDLLHDVGLYAIHLVILFVLIYIRKYNNQFKHLFQGLLEESIIDVSKTDHEKYIKRYNKIYGNLFSRITIYILSVSFTVLHYFSFNLKGELTWLSINGTSLTLGSIATIFCTVAIYYVSLKLLYILVSSCLILVDYFKRDNIRLNIQVLHPDRSGGLGSIGRLSRTITMVVFVMGIGVGVMLYNNINIHHFSFIHPINILTLAGYVVGSLIIVFAPVLSVHGKMSDSKIKFLHTLNLEFERANEIVKTSLVDGESEELIKKISTIKNIKELYDIAAVTPVWPFNYKVIYSYLVSIASPFLYMLYEKLISGLSA